MAKRLNLLLLDANVVIHLFKLGLWDRILDVCDIHLAQTVVEEVDFYKDEEGEHHNIDLKPDLIADKVHSFSLPATALAAFRDQFGIEYIEKLDPGEVESLVHLLSSSKDWLLCSADKIVFRVLGNLDRRDQGISLEEVLQKVGLPRRLDHQYQKAYRVWWSDEGVKERMQGRGLKRRSRKR
jgi:hypothetical protein